MTKNIVARVWLFGVLATALCMSGTSAQERAVRGRGDGNRPIRALDADGCGEEDGAFAAPPVVYPRYDPGYEPSSVTMSFRLVWPASPRVAWTRPGDRYAYALMILVGPGGEPDRSLAARIEELTEHSW